MTHPKLAVLTCLLLCSYGVSEHTRTRAFHRQAKLLDYRVAQAKMRGFPLTREQFEGRVLKSEENAEALLAGARSDALARVDRMNMPAPEQLPAVRTALADAAPYFSRIERACSLGKFQYRRSPESLSFQDQAALRSAVRSLCLRAQVRAIDGDADGALEDIRRALILTNYALKRSTMIDCLVTVAMHAIICTRCEILASLWVSDPTRLGALERLIVSAYAPIDAQRVVRQESFVAAHLLDFEVDRAPAKGTTDEKTHPNALDKKAFRSLMLAMALKRYDVLTQNPTEPWRLSKQIHAWAKRESRKLSEARRGTNDPMGEIVNPTFDQAYNAFGKRAALQSCLVSLIRCLRYKAEHHHLASTLDEMKAKFNDPFSKGALRLKVTSNGFKVYSIGPDRVDQGGRTRFETRDPGMCDVVMGIPPVNSALTMNPR